MNCFVIVRLGK